jgi:hypothetical protein
MSTARFLIGDVHERMAQLEPGTYDLVITSPPFLALRSYLPDGHPDKHQEIGSEPTPAAFLDVMLALTAEWGRLLAPHGSLAIEIGDTYSGSGGAGGDYADDGLRAGQQRFDGSASRAYGTGAAPRPPRTNRGGMGGRASMVEQATGGHHMGGGGWPLPKSLAMIPELYAASLAYGRNLLTGEPSPAGRWRVRNFKPWIRSNPPVGALGDKERPATSYVTVATRAVDRYFDLDAVRVAPSRPREGTVAHKVRDIDDPNVKRGSDLGTHELNNPAGAPPLDWYHEADAVIDAEIDRRAGKTANANKSGSGGGHHGRSGEDGTTRLSTSTGGAVGARGVHIRRALEAAGHLTTQDALDVSPKGYKGAHYAVWPAELVRRLIAEMAPHRVCTTCGQPSRRITETEHMLDGQPADLAAIGDGERLGEGASGVGHWRKTTDRTTTGWSDCGCPGDHWRRGRILDPFAGSGTTLAVATGMGLDVDGVDLDERNAHLAIERVGLFLTVEGDDRAAAS